MTPIQSSKTVFFDNSGNVLENGYIYIGQPSTNPQVSGNQKTVTFEDSSGYQFTASQPLRTIAGRIVYNGRPITALVDGVHSMLVLNSASVQIEYTASITPSDTAGTVDLSDTIRVGLTLDAVKAFDVAVGDVVRSVGSATATDGLGADWLTISATGGAGDDVDLIDFDNGLQGQRDNNKIYRSEQIGTHYFASPITVVSTTNATSYRETWTEIDISANVPQTASAAIIRIYADATYPTSGIDSRIAVSAHVRKSDSSASNGLPNLVGHCVSQNPTTVPGTANFLSECAAPLVGGVPASFDFHFAVQDPTVGAGNCLSPDLSIFLVGYVITVS